MSVIRQRLLACLLPVSAFMLCFGMAARAQSPEQLRVDHPAQVDGIRTACTGIGNSEENEGRWGDYAVKLETVGGYGQWLGDQDVTVHGKGQDIAVHCAGPWLLMGLEPGQYDATVRVPNAAPKEVHFSVPATGQRDVIVRFHDKDSGQERPSGT